MTEQEMEVWRELFEQHFRDLQVKFSRIDASLDRLNATLEVVSGKIECGPDKIDLLQMKVDGKFEEVMAALRALNADQRPQRFAGSLGLYDNEFRQRLASIRRGTRG